MRDAVLCSALCMPRAVRFQTATRREFRVHVIWIRTNGVAISGHPYPACNPAGMPVPRMPVPCMREGAFVQHESVSKARHPAQCEPQCTASLFRNSRFSMSTAGAASTRGCVSGTWHARACIACPESIPRQWTPYPALRPCWHARPPHARTPHYIAVMTAHAAFDVRGHAQALHCTTRRTTPRQRTAGAHAWHVEERGDHVP